MSATLPNSESLTQWYEDMFQSKNKNVLAADRFYIQSDLDSFPLGRCDF